MPRDSNGVASTDPVYLAVTGETIRAVQHNTPIEDIISMLTGSLARNGTGGMQANLAMGGFKVTGIANATLADDAMAYGQLSGGIGTVLASGVGTAKFTGAISKSGIINPAQITANQDNYAPTQASAPTTLGEASVIRLTSDAARTITGLVAPTTNPDGREMCIVNIGSFPLTLAAESASSTAANRIAAGGNIVIQAGGCALLWYDTTSSRWRPRTDAGQFNASHIGSGTLSVDRLPSGTIIDRSYDENTAATQLTSAIPQDDTVPQITEGTQIFSKSFTPKSTTSRLRCRCVLIAGAPADATLVGAMFVNGGANAVRAWASGNGSGTLYQTVVLEYEFVPGSVSAQTISVRAGGVSSGQTLTLNGAGNGTRRFGGAAACTLVIEEIAA